MSKSVLTAFTLCLVLSAVTALADDAEPDDAAVLQGEMTPEERRAAWEKLSEEEKQAKRQEWRAKREAKRAEWEAMTPEEREAKRAEMRKKWDEMTPEQREAIKKRRKQRRPNREHRGDRDQGGR